VKIKGNERRRDKPVGFELKFDTLYFSCGFRRRIDGCLEEPRYSWSLSLKMLNKETRNYLLKKVYKEASKQQSGDQPNKGKRLLKSKSKSDGLVNSEGNSLTTAGRERLGNVS
jgi:hypothetical protein